MYMDEYPGGPEVLDKSILGGELFLTFLFNPVSLFTAVSYFLNMLLIVEMNFNPMKNVVCGFGIEDSTCTYIFLNLYFVPFNA